MYLETKSSVRFWVGASQKKGSSHTPAQQNPTESTSTCGFYEVVEDKTLFCFVLFLFQCSLSYHSQMWKGRKNEMADERCCEPQLCSLELPAVKALQSPLCYFTAQIVTSVRSVTNALCMETCIWHITVIGLGGQNFKSRDGKRRFSNSCPCITGARNQQCLEFFCV